MGNYLKIHPTILSRLRFCNHVVSTSEKVEGFPFLQHLFWGLHLVFSPISKGNLAKIGVYSAVPSPPALTKRREMVVSREIPYQNGGFEVLHKSARIKWHEVCYKTRILKQWENHLNHVTIADHLGSTELQLPICCCLGTCKNGFLETYIWRADCKSCFLLFICKFNAFI